MSPTKKPTDLGSITLSQVPGGTPNRRASFRFAQLLCCCPQRKAGNSPANSNNNLHQQQNNEQKQKTDNNKQESETNNANNNNKKKLADLSASAPDIPNAKTKKRSSEKLENVNAVTSKSQVELQRQHSNPRHVAFDIGRNTTSEGSFGGRVFAGESNPDVTAAWETFLAKHPPPPDTSSSSVATTLTHTGDDTGGDTTDGDTEDYDYDEEDDRATPVLQNTKSCVVQLARKKSEWLMRDKTVKQESGDFKSQSLSTLTDVDKNENHQLKRSKETEDIRKISHFQQDVSKMDE